MEGVCGPAMLATLAGFLALLFGLLLLLLPVLIQELSRPRDSVWGAVVLLLGLVLVTSSERLTGAPMLAVLCAGLLIGRLGGEVAQARWCALSQEERLQLGSRDRWQRSLNQLAASLASLLQAALTRASAAQAWLAQRRQGQGPGRSHGKRWVRREHSGVAAPQPAGELATPEPTTTPDTPAMADAPDAPDAPDMADMANIADTIDTATTATTADTTDVADVMTEMANIADTADTTDTATTANTTNTTNMTNTTNVADLADVADAIAMTEMPIAAGPGAADEALAELGLAADRSTPAGPGLAVVAAAGRAGSPEARPAGTAPIPISDFSEVDALLDQAAAEGETGPQAS